ncbi:MAG TPA: thiamine pyrophosphate-dependent dehydrogenase E1 component subunit alpha [Vicinamibacterales bacterium]|nr:thiamine pyrophosphate-dependent dehydrogenase E1 component subunit alpha [Vicinamibacterales bacterium]
MATKSKPARKPSDALSGNQLLEMYWFARLAREIEERLVILFRQSKVIGGLYRSLGQEGESVATAYALKKSDAILPLIRNMGALMTMGIRPKEIFLQYMAKGESNTRGRDLNIHIVHMPEWTRNGSGGEHEPVVVGPISMLGDSIPVAAGIAMGARMRRSAGSRQAAADLVAMAWIGDGATSTGAFHEGLNFAAVQKAPLVVIAEDNKYAYSTPISKQMAIRRIDERAAAYGIPHEMVDGNDMLAVYDAAKRMVDRARGGDGASLLGVDTMRMQGHAQHDDARYVPKALIEEWQKRDPIARFTKVLLERGAATEQQIAEIDRQAKSYAAAEADLAEQSPAPDPASVTRGVYAEDDYAQPRLEFVASPFAERP